MLKFANDFGFALKACKLSHIPLEQTPHYFHGDLPKGLVFAQINFGHSPAGYKIIDLDFSDFPACPVSHAENYNRD